MKLHLQIAALVCLISLLAPPAAAEWVQARGEYSFGPEVSEEQACQRAERRAKDQALKTAQGERLSSDDMLVCKEKDSQADCEINRFTWSSINGLIAGLRHIKRENVVLKSPYRTCIVTLEANIEMAKGTPDPGFDLSVQLNEKLFRDGDIMRLMITPSQPMYINVFQWLPYERTERQIMRIFPNVMDRDNRFVTQAPIPSVQGAKNYDMVVGFPQGRHLPDRLVDEYLMIVATVRDISFRDDYTLEEFNKRLLEIPRAQSRLIKRAYMIAKP